MELRRPLQLLAVLLLAFALAGRTVPEASGRALFQEAETSTILTGPRESLPLPVHDEATCAFCQAAMFAPHAGSTAGMLPVVWGTEHPAPLSYDDSFSHSGSTRPPRSRAPPQV